MKLRTLSLLLTLLAAACDAGGLLIVEPADAGCDLAPDAASLLDDNANCGACGVVCAAAHASADCDVGICIVDQCEPGWEDADHDYATGCELPVKR